MVSGCHELLSLLLILLLEKLKLLLQGLDSILHLKPLLLLLPYSLHQLSLLLSFPLYFFLKHSDLSFQPIILQFEKVSYCFSSFLPKFVKPMLFPEAFGFQGGVTLWVQVLYY